MKVDVPQGWTRQSIEGLTSKCRSGYWGNTEPSDGDQPCRVIRNGDVRKDTTIESKLPRRFLNQRQIDRAKVSGGDVILVTSGAYTGNVARIRTGNGDEPIVASNFVRLLRPGSDTDGVFLGHLLASGLAQRRLKGFIAGTAIENLQSDVYEILELPVPPLPEQQKIAAILSSVDDAIAATRKAVEQTKRVKKGLLQDLMTRGIGHTRFKRTEIGEIPVEWKVSRLEDLVKSVTDYRGKTPPYTDEGIPVISAANVSDGEVHGVTNYVTKKTFEEWTTRGLQEPGDVLFTTEAPVAEVARVPFDRQYLITRRIVALTPSSKISQNFLFWYMLRLSQKNFWKRFMHGSTVPRILKPDLMRTQIPVPPRTEQEAISKRLESVLAYEMSLGDSIPGLSRLKRGLMQDLLTGRVRVPVD